MYFFCSNRNLYLNIVRAVLFCLGLGISDIGGPAADRARRPLRFRGPDVWIMNVVLFGVFFIEMVQ